ncbi:MAG: hypothetical protein M0R37_03275 [Bacteroidales bacterium]|nr:hypothetical protein [Bacteroidales bacterium]
MKKIIFLIVLFVSASNLFAGNGSQNPPKMNYYGVDFSMVKVFGAKESSDKFIQAFEEINKLIIAESTKYPFTTFFTKYAHELDNAAELKRQRFESFDNVNIDEAIYRSRVMDGNSMSTYNKQYKLTDQNISSLIKSFNTGKDTGYGVLYVAEMLDRQDAMGRYVIVCFNVKTKRILFTERVQGKSGGFGLRNYWGATLEKIMKL